MAPFRKTGDLGRGARRADGLRHEERQGEVNRSRGAGVIALHERPHLASPCPRPAGRGAGPRVTPRPARSTRPASSASAASSSGSASRAVTFAIPSSSFSTAGRPKPNHLFLKQFAPWQADYTVVNWDQRGSGRTLRQERRFDARHDARIACARTRREVAEHARKRLAKEANHPRRSELGHGAGTAHVIKRWPELFHAFVGTGQAGELAAQDRSAGALGSRASHRERRCRDAESAGRHGARCPRPTPNGSAPRASTASPRVISSTSRSPARFIGPPPSPKEGEVADWLAGSQFTLPQARPRRVRVRRPQARASTSRCRISSSRAATITSRRSKWRKPISPKCMRRRRRSSPSMAGTGRCFTNPTAFVAALRRHVRPLAT